MALAAIAAGKAVYCEKPLSISSESTARMRDAARRAGACTMVGFNFLTNPMIRCARDILAAHLDLHTGLHPIDGSGLSYENRGSAEAVCRLLDRMLESPHREAWLSTFKERQVGDTTILAKTGTLAVARCLAGYAPTPEGGWMAFAVLLNRGESRSIGWARDLRRDFARALVENASKP